MAKDGMGYKFIVSLGGVEGFKGQADKGVLKRWLSLRAI